MGHEEVLLPTRALDFNTQSQVIREAIGLMGEAVPSTKGTRKRRKPGSYQANSLLGRSNPKFAKCQGLPLCPPAA